MRYGAFSLLCCALSWLVIHSNSKVSAADALQQALQQIQALDAEDTPNSVSKAWKTVAASDIGQLPLVLSSIQGSNPLAANWLRSAADAIAQRAIASQQPLPITDLENFVLQTKHDPRARRQAFELLQTANPKLAAEMIPGMLQDPSVELRREAVALYMATAEQRAAAGDQQAAIDNYRQALDGARDEDQVKLIAKQLRDLNQTIDLPRHFGFIQNWQLIAPFDNAEQAGLEVVYPPETKIDLQAEYPGKGGPAKWQAYSSSHDFGMIDLNQPFGPLKEVVGYAWTEFESPTERAVELRLGCKNAWKVWVNGELLFSRNEYHRGMQMDQYRLPVTLKAGPNQVLVKLCQNGQTESWTVEWQFQLRVCDATGTAILSANRP